jgi:hypothetical protein
MNIVSVIGPEMKASNVVIWKIYCIVCQSGAIIRLSAFEQRHWQLARKSNPFWQSGKIRHSTTVQMLLVFSCDVFVILLEEWSQQFNSSGRNLYCQTQLWVGLNFVGSCDFVLSALSQSRKIPITLTPFRSGDASCGVELRFTGFTRGQDDNDEEC